MQRKGVPPKEEHDEEEEEEEEEHDGDGGEDQDQEDDDFDFKDQKKGGAPGPGAAGRKDEAAKKVENLPFDEAVELSEQESMAQDDDHKEPPKQKVNMGQKLQPQAATQARAQQPPKQDDDDDGHDGGEGHDFPGAYNPADYDNLNVASDVKDLFKYIGRYKPLNIDLDARLRVFIPDLIPAVGEVDAFLKIPRPDGMNESMGLTVLDEPTLNQSKKSKLDLQFREFLKKSKTESTKVVHSIENAEKNPKEILAWISDVADIQKNKQPPSVSYSKQMPEIDNLMQVWPPEFEDALQSLKIPTEDFDVDLETYCRMACALLDIPVHNTANNKNVVESLHVFFTLYSEFKANQHFRQMNQNQDGGGTMHHPSTPNEVHTLKF